MRYLGSARVSRAGFGVPPKRTLFFHYPKRFNAYGKVRDREDALASTRDACAPQSFCDHG